MNELDFGTLLLRLLVTVVATGLIGFDRELKGRTAGLVTHIVVGLGCAAFALMSVAWAGSAPSALLRGSDAMRVVAGVATGIGFLGGGAILHGPNHVEGLTTAAGIWVVAATGLACGMGFLSLGMTVATVTFLVMRFGKRLERYIRPKPDLKVIDRQEP